MPPACREREAECYASADVKGVTGAGGCRPRDIHETSSKGMGGIRAATGPPLTLDRGVMVSQG